MNFDYINYLREQLNILKNNLELNIELEIADEQDFVKQTTYSSNRVYVIYKALSSSLSYYSKQQPFNLTIITEENQMQDTQILFNKFAEQYNWIVVITNNVHVKQQYSTPIVMSNFTEVANGYRSILYLSGSLFITEKILDVSNFQLDGINTQLLNFQLQYSMTGNTQPTGNNNLASTEKNVATLGFSGAIPLINRFTKQETRVLEGNTSGSYSMPIQAFETSKSMVVKIGGTHVAIDSNKIDFVVDDNVAWKVEQVVEISLVKKLLNVIKGSISGNVIFNVTFSLGDVVFDVDMKLTNSTITTAPDQIPGITFSMLK